MSDPAPYTTEPLAWDTARVAHELSLSRSTLIRLCNAGEIPHRRVGRRVLFPRAALLTWLESADDAVTQK